MGFFDKINNSTIVNAFKQFCNRRDCEIFCMDVPQWRWQGLVVVQLNWRSKVLGSSPDRGPSDKPQKAKQFLHFKSHILV